MIVPCWSGMRNDYLIMLRFFTCHGDWTAMAWLNCRVTLRHLAGSLKWKLKPYEFAQDLDYEVTTRCEMGLIFRLGNYSAMYAKQINDKLLICRPMLSVVVSFILNLNTFILLWNVPLLFITWKSPIGARYARYACLYCTHQSSNKLVP